MTLVTQTWHLICWREGGKDCCPCLELRAPGLPSQLFTDKAGPRWTANCSCDFAQRIMNIFFFFFEKGWCVFVPGVYNLILNIMFINLLNEWILDCCNTVSKTKCFLWTPLSSASNSILWDWRAMSPVTAVSVNTELFVCYKRSRRTVLWDRIVVPAGGTVALLLDGLHCVF